MIWLALDGALGSFSAAVLDDGAAFVPQAATSEGNDALERGLAVTRDVLAAAERRLTDVDAVAVGIGPGSFTGLRIAIAYAKALALARAIGVAAVSSFDAVEPADVNEATQIADAYATFVSGRAGITCARLRLADESQHAGADARGWRDYRFAGTYEVVAAEIASAIGSRDLLPAYGDVAGVAGALAERGIIVRALAATASIPALTIAKRAAARGLVGSPHRIVADYGEATYAERVR